MISVEPRDFQQTLEAYKLAILAGFLKKEKNAVLAGLCRRLAWHYNGEWQRKRNVRAREELTFGI